MSRDPVRERARGSRSGEQCFIRAAHRPQREAQAGLNMDAAATAETRQSVRSLHRQVFDLPSALESQRRSFIGKIRFSECVLQRSIGSTVKN